METNNKIHDGGEGQNVYYQVTGGNLTRYTYLCRHPNNENYYILIDEFTKDPVRLYKDEIARLYTDKVQAYQKAIEYHQRAIKGIEKIILNDDALIAAEAAGTQPNEPRYRMQDILDEVAAEAGQPVAGNAPTDERTEEFHRLRDAVADAAEVIAPDLIRHIGSLPPDVQLRVETLANAVQAYEKALKS